MNESTCSHDQQVIELYTALARHPDRDFGWAKESWADCVAGTLDKQALLDSMKASGFHAPEFVATTHYRTAGTTVGATFRASKAPDNGHAS